MAEAMIPEMGWTSECQVCRPAIIQIETYFGSSIFCILAQ